MLRGEDFDYQSNNLLRRFPMDITVSFDAIAAMGVAMAVCLAFPFGFIVYNRKKMMLMPIIAGIIGYLLLGFFISGVCIDSLARLIAAPFLGSLLSAAGYSAVVVFGSRVIQKYLQGKYSGGGVALSYGLGFSFINLVIMHGAELFSSISLATAINNNGFELVSTTVDDPDSLFELVSEIANKSTLVHYLGAAELACYFILTVAVSVLIWYSIANNDRVCFGLALVGEFVVMMLLNYCAQGGVDILVTEIVYAVISLGLAVYAYFIYNRYGDGEKYMADPVRRF